MKKLFEELVLCYVICSSGEFLGYQALNTTFLCVFIHFGFGKRSVPWASRRGKAAGLYHLPQSPQRSKVVRVRVRETTRLSKLPGN